MEGKLFLLVGVFAFLVILGAVLWTALGKYPDAGGRCVNVLDPLMQKIYSIIPQLQPKNDYTCPAGEWIDCMPGPGPVKPQCQKDYLDWAVKNCPGFRGAAL